MSGHQAPVLVSVGPSPAPSSFSGEFWARRPKRSSGAGTSQLQGADSGRGRPCPSPTASGFLAVSPAGLFLAPSPCHGMSARLLLTWGLYIPFLPILSLSQTLGPLTSKKRTPRTLGETRPAPARLRRGHPRPTPPVATFRFTAGSSIPTSEGTCATAAGAPGRRTRQANLPAPPGPPPRLQPQLSSGPCESGHVIAVRLLRDGVGVHALPPGSQLPRLKAQAAPGGGRRTSGFLSQRARYLAELLSQQVD